MQDSLTFPTLGSPPRLIFPEFIHYSHGDQHQHHDSCCSELSSSTSTPFVSAPSSPSRMKGFYFSAPASPTWAQQQQQQQQQTLSFAQPSSIPYWRQQQELAGFKGDVDSSSRSISSWSHRRFPQTDNFSHGPTAWSPNVSPSFQNLVQLEYSVDSYNSSQQQSTPETEHSVSAKHDGGPDRPHPQSLRTEHHSRPPCRYHQASQMEHALKRHQVDDLDTSYSRPGFYASAVPFAWEERPGTPKARSVTSEASNGEDDAASVLLSGSSEFEFSARFAELEEPPMSPTPIASSPSSFRKPLASPSPTYMRSGATTEEQIWPLRPPPRLNSPVLPMKQLIKDDANEHNKHSCGSLSSLSAPQSPRSPRKFDVRGVLCGISSPVDEVFDPFLVAMEKSMAKGTNDCIPRETQKTMKKKRGGDMQHRRTQSSSPLSVFHWDDHSAKLNSSSNGSSSMDDMKSNKHPIQREIDARHNARMSKGSKRWSFRGFLHKKSDSGGESLRHSNRSSSLRSSGSESNTLSTSRRESSSSSAMGEAVATDMSNQRDDMNIAPPSALSASSKPSVLSPSSSAKPAGLSPSSSSKRSVMSPSSSSNSIKGKLNAHHHRGSSKGPYALHYDMQKAHTEELRKKTFLPYKQGLLGCLGLSSKSYRAIAAFSKPLQPVS